MIDKTRIAFKRCFAQTLIALRIDQAEFDESRSYNDFLIENFNPGSFSAQVVAANALRDLCNHDGSLFDLATCIAVIAFLDEACGAPKADSDKKQRMTDLAGIVRAAPKQKVYEEWISSWYD